MIDMWFLNSVTFIYSHCFLIVCTQVTYILVIMILNSTFTNFFAVESSSETPNILLTVNLLIFSAATHTMLYNMNIWVKLSLNREAQLKKNELVRREERECIKELELGLEIQRLEEAEKKFKADLYRRRGDTEEIEGLLVDF